MSIEGQGHFLPYIFQVLNVLCFTRPRYQVSVYRTIGPLVFISDLRHEFEALLTKFAKVVGYGIHKCVNDTDLKFGAIRYFPCDICKF